MSSQLKEAVPDLGMIMKIVRKYWVVLPAHAKTSYDIEDMLSDVLVHIIKNSQKFDPKKSAAVTWIGSVATNRCIDIISSYNSQSRVSPTIPLEDPELENGRSEKWQSSEIAPSQITDSLNAVERILFVASRELANWIDTVFFKRRWRKPNPEIVNELRKLSSTYNVGADDFRVVSCYLAEQL